MAGKSPYQQQLVKWGSIDFGLFNKRQRSLAVVRKMEAEKEIFSRFSFTFSYRREDVKLVEKRKTFVKSWRRIGNGFRRNGKVVDSSR